MASNSLEERNQNLMLLAQTVINQEIHYKLDKIADIYIHGLLYFSVFRRYNSVYEYILEYVNGETYLHKNKSIRESLRTVFSLSKEQIAPLHTSYFYSYRHTAFLEKVELADRTWTDIWKSYGAISVNFEGIFSDFQRVYDAMNRNKEENEVKNEIVIPEEPWCVVIPKEEKKEDNNNYLVLRSGLRYPKRNH